MACRRLHRYQIIAPSFGWMLSFDQNEKLEMFGVTYFMGIDAHSRYIAFLIAVPRKNAIALYEKGFKYVAV
jgi:hypothetical protein